MSAAIEQRNQEATCYCGGLDERVSEELLWELMLQAGPVVNVHIPRDKVTGNHQAFGFVEFRTEEDADYACKVMNMVRLFSKPIRVNKASQDRKNIDVGANLFIGNLAPEVDEKDLYDTFSAFGGITQPPKIMFDTDTGNSKGYGFVSYDSFEASDYAIECMNGAYLGGRPIVVQYAYKKDSKGERHGSQAERLLAASNLQAVRFKPNTMFATGPGQQGVGIPTVQLPQLTAYQATPPTAYLPTTTQPYNMQPPPPPPAYTQMMTPQYAAYAQPQPQLYQSYQQYIPSPAPQAYYPQQPQVVPPPTPSPTYLPQGYGSLQPPPPPPRSYQ